MDVPKLRFNFQAAYTNYILSEIVSFENGKGHETMFSENGKYIIVNSKFISTQGNTILKKANRQLVPLKKSDITMVMSDLPNGKALAKCFFVEADNIYTLNQRICKLSTYSNFCAKYIYYLLDRNKYFLKFDDGVNQTNLKKNDIINFKCCIPEFREQTKIADFLSLLDKKIELQTKKIEDLKLYKKGLINNLIDNVDNYQNIPLKELGTTYSGLSGKSKEDFENGNCKFISFISVLKDSIDINSLTKVKVNNNEKQNKVKKYDLFFNTSSETRDEVALCSTICEDIPNLYLNSFCFGYRINNLNIINNEYLNSLLHCSYYRNKISNLGQGFTRVNISKKELLELSVKVPSIYIQNRIVNINNKIKIKIKLEENKLNKLQELKKGLMQSMFV